MIGRARDQTHIAVRLTIRSDQEDLATGLLWDLEPAGLELQAETSPGELPIVAYFPSRPGLVDDVRAHLASLMPTKVEEVAVPEVDWAENFRKSFRGFTVGEFQIVPCWEPRPQNAARLLVVDPGRAFGTGTHETTRLCLQFLDTLSANASLGRVLDVGTGTGILALAALRCGARQAIGTDNDPEAIASAHEHARLNGLHLDLLLSDGVSALLPGTCDVILANLMAPLLIALRDGLAALRAPGGRLVLSGLLATDIPEISAAFGALGRLDVRVDGEWAAVAVLP